MLALFVGLGVWQLQRRVEKHALIAALTERLAAPPEALPPPSQWGALTPARDEFRRVRFAATYRALPGCDGLQLRLRGARRISPVPAPGLSCRRGCRAARPSWSMPASCQNTMQDRAPTGSRGDAGSSPGAGDADRLLRFPGKGRRADAGGKSRQAAVVHPRSSGDGAGAGLGRGRSRRSISIWRRRCRPSGIPKPGPLEVHLKDDHMQYAITWFALAGAVVIAFGVWLRAPTPA